MLSRRTAIGLIGAGLSLARPRSAVAQTSVLEEPWAAGHLAGTFARPATEVARGPAALIIAGSGPTPRDGTFGTYRLIAHALAAEGIRSLRYDKRGVGQSRAGVDREDELVLRHFVDDAILAAQSLAARPDVSSVIVIGHSEGALVATKAAAEAPPAAIVLLAGIGRRLDVVLREQLMAMPLPPTHEMFRTQALAILERLSRGERVADVSADHAPLFRPSVQPFLISMFAVDPAAALKRLTLPVMLIRGASDIQVSATDLDLLAAARPDARSLTLRETNHVFKPAPADVSDRAAQLKSYDPAAPLAPGLMPVLLDFFRARAP